MFYFIDVIKKILYFIHRPVFGSCLHVLSLIAVYDHCVNNHCFLPLNFRMEFLSFIRFWYNENLNNAFIIQLHLQWNNLTADNCADKIKNKKKNKNKTIGLRGRHCFNHIYLKLCFSLNYHKKEKEEEVGEKTKFVSLQGYRLWCSAAFFPLIFDCWYSRKL